MENLKIILKFFKSIFVIVTILQKYRGKIGEEKRGSGRFNIT